MSRSILRRVATRSSVNLSSAFPAVRRVVRFEHSGQIWRDFPELVPGIVFAEGITHTVPVDNAVAGFTARASSRLAERTESELPEIQAWRRAFARMGLKPTQYRCASESLLRRFRMEHQLPAIHPVLDLCSAVSLAFAVPIAVFDVAHVVGGITVRPATGDERRINSRVAADRADQKRRLLAHPAERACVELEGRCTSLPVCVQVRPFVLTIHVGWVVA